MTEYSGQKRVAISFNDLKTPRGQGVNVYLCSNNVYHSGDYLINPI